MVTIGTKDIAVKTCSTPAGKDVDEVDVVALTNEFTSANVSVKSQPTSPVSAARST
jgi:hypothetical protein